MTQSTGVTRDEVLDFLKRYQQTYENSDLAFFDLFARDATFFTISSPTRIDSVEEFRRGFEPNFTTGAKRRAQILSPEIRITENVISVTFHNRVSVNGQTTNMRASLVILKDQQGNLRITHQHHSPLGTPSVPAAATSVEGITLLEERVATAAATVGTPK